MTNTKLKKNKHLTGYRLHNRRFRFSKKQGMRTIKFPLGVWDSKQGKVVMGDIEKDFAQKIRDDYIKLYGPLNLADYIKGVPYSYKDFWVDLLRAGAVLKHTEPKMLDDISVIEKRDVKLDKQQKELMKATNAKFFDLIEVNFEKFKKEFILTGSKRSTTTKNSLHRKLLECFSKQNKNERNYAEKIATEFYQLIIDENKSGEDQEKYWFDNYGVDKKIYAVDEGGKASTFFLFPDIELDKNLSPKECVERVDKWRYGHFGDTDKVKEFIGISDNQGGLSQIGNTIFEYLLEGDIEPIKNIFTSMSPTLWKGNEAELDKRLRWLSKQAQKIGKPQVIGNWGDYRSDVGGKIQSWVSNTQGQDEKIHKLLFGYEEEKYDKKANKKKKDHHKGHKDEIEKILNTDLGDLKNTFEVKVGLEYDEKDRDAFSEKEQDIRGSIIPTMEETLKKIDSVYKQSNRIDIELLLDYREQLTRLKVHLNFLFQWAYGEQNEEDESDTKKKGKQKTVDSAYKTLFKELPRIPSFFGEVKLREDNGTYPKYMESYDRIVAGIDFFIGLHSQSRKLKDFNSEKIEKDAERIEMSLQRLLSAYRNAQSKKGRDILSGTLNKFLQDSINDQFIQDKDHQDDYIWRSPRARDRKGDKMSLQYEQEELIQKLEVLLNKIDIRWDKYKNNIHINEWLDFIAIEKVATGLLFYFYDLKPNLKSKALRKHYIKIDVVEARYNNNLDNNAYNTIIQTAILAEMQGTVSKMSTEQLICRYVVQPIDSEQKFPILTDVEFEKERRKKQRYYIQYKSFEQDGEGEEDTVEMNKVAGKKLTDKKSYKKDSKVKTTQLLRISSSKYQLQFLDNSIGQQWSEFKPEIASYSFIYEEQYNIKWATDGPSLKLQDEKLFVSIPFKLGYTGKDEKRNKQIVQRTKFLGVDIGEYGVATYILDSDDLQKQGRTSFIFEPTIRKIRDGIKENKDQQKAGTFSIPNTQIKRLRDNTSTSIRNRVHAIVLANNARPVYEAEVSAFESGSGKTSKVYHSIKRSDVYSQNAADQLETDLTWGKSSKLIGKNIGAYATSYSCSKCFKSVYTYIPRNDYNNQYQYTILQEWKTRDEKGNTRYNTVCEFQVNGVKIKGYLKSDKPLKEINGKGALKAMKEYARPPLKVIQKRCPDLFKDKKQKERWEARHGNQAIFICPFCDNVSDADKQAALWIALKGYLNMFISNNSEEQKYWNNKDIKQEWGKDGIEEKIEYMLKFAKQNKIPAVGLDIDD